MTIVVAAVLFDYKRGQPSACTIPLRYDSAQFVLLPEWQRGQALPSVAAYAIDRITPSVSVLVRLAASPDEPRLIEVRALTQPMPGGGLPSMPLLGDLHEERIVFDSTGNSGWRGFTFQTAALTAGVDVASIQWRWQCRRHGQDSWNDIDLTSHKVYAVLSQPTEPWLVRPAVSSNTSLPRTDMLDVACLWARGARDPTQAATRITEAVNRLGGLTISYDALVGAPHYTVLGAPRFLCDAFLDRLRGGFGAGPLVNCSDCATIVSTFANLLGADLWQSKMGLLGSGFRLNPILAIGSEEWSTLFGAFAFHEVAWTGACAEDNLVFDACASLDRDADPAQAPHVAELPVGLRFGWPGDRQYRDRIAAPDARDECAPQPSLRIRRPIGQAVVLAQRLPARVQSSIAERIQLDEGDAPRDEVWFEDFVWFGGELPGWSLADTAVFDVPSWPRVLLMNEFPRAQVEFLSRVVISVWRSTRRASAVLRLESYETGSSAQARRKLVEVVADVQHPGLQPWDRGVEGETALSLPNGAFAMFTRGNHLHVARSAGRESTDVRDDAERIDRWLIGAGSSLAAPMSTMAKFEFPHWRRLMRNAAASPYERARSSPAGQQFIVTPSDAHTWEYVLRSANQ